MELFKIVIIVLKIAEIVSLLIATGTVGHFLNEFRDDEIGVSGPTPSEQGIFGRLEFFLCITSVGMFIDLVVFSLVIIGILNKVKGIEAMITIHAIWTFLLLVSSALLAKTVGAYDEKNKNSGRSLCDTFDKNDTDYQCSQLITGVVFGFVAMVLFFLDSAMFIFTYVNHQGTSPQQSTGSKSANAPSTVEAKTNPVTLHA